uniref:Uncharacterized protein n=1 Tax=Arundo donax TaxID=35708 RepID=A0A0A9A1I6_ARUDO
MIYHGFMVSWFTTCRLNYYSCCFGSRRNNLLLCRGGARGWPAGAMP